MSDENLNIDVRLKANVTIAKVTEHYISFNARVPLYDHHRHLSQSVALLRFQVLNLATTRHPCPKQTIRPMPARKFKPMSSDH